MTLEVFFKLLAIFAMVALGWLSGRLGWIGGKGSAGLPGAVKALSDVAFMLFVPALLFRTMAHLDFATLPWATLVAFFVPATAYLLAVYGLARRRRDPSDPAAPATTTFSTVYGNAVQLGIPMSAALFGAQGLALHVAMVSLHGLLLITLLTVLVELDIARADRASTLGSTVRATVRNAVRPPGPLPGLSGRVWNLSGSGLHPVPDQTLALLASAVVPVCLVLIGLSLAQYGLKGRVRQAVGLSALKLGVMPAVVLVVAHFGFGLTGVPLGVVVMMAALPVGSNALIFAQRYGTGQAEATAGIVVSTIAFTATASVWLLVLSAVG
ncbi:MAG: AEC family transporter [Rubrivivax sp.]